MQGDAVGSAEHAATGRPVTPPPVYVVAAPHMYGAHLTAMLGRNPAAFALPETNLALAETLEMLVRELMGLRGPQLHGLLRALALLLSGEQSMASVEMAWRWIFGHTHWPTEKVARFLRQRIAPQVAVERVTAALYEEAALPRLAEAEPDAVYVRLTRHPMGFGRAVMASAGGATAQILGGWDRRGAEPVLDPQFLWLTSERRIDAVLAGMPAAACHALRIEDLLATPRAGLTALAEKLHLPHDSGSVARMLQPEHGPFSGFGPLGANYGEDPDFLADPRLPDAAGNPLLTLPDLSLDGALPWRADGAGFTGEVVARARAWGYS